MAENFAYDLIESFDNPSDAEETIKMMHDDVEAVINRAKEITGMNDVKDKLEAVNGLGKMEKINFYHRYSMWDSAHRSFGEDKRVWIPPYEFLSDRGVGQFERFCADFVRYVSDVLSDEEDIVTEISKGYLDNDVVRNILYSYED